MYTEIVDMRGRQLGKAQSQGLQSGGSTLTSCPAGPELARKPAGGPGTLP